MTTIPKVQQIFAAVGGTTGHTEIIALDITGAVWRWTGWEFGWEKLDKATERPQ